MMVNGRPTRQPYSSCPPNNYLAGTGMSHAYQGIGYYVPSERNTIPLQNNYKIPPADRPDRIPIECESDYINYVRNRDCVNGYHNRHIGILPSGRPNLMLFGNKRNLPGMPSPEEYARINPLNYTWQTVSRGPRGEYYSYYHEAIERERERRRRELPFPLRIRPTDVPEICVNGRINLYTNGGMGGLKN